MNSFPHMLYLLMILLASWKKNEVRTVPFNGINPNRNDLHDISTKSPEYE